MYDIWRMQAINELSELPAKYAALQNIPSRILELETSRVSIKSSLADSSGARGGSSREDALLNNLVTQHELEEALKLTQSDIERTERALHALTPENQKILDYFFVSPRKGAVSMLAEELGIEEKTVYNRRNAALRMFTMAMYGNLI